MTLNQWSKRSLVLLAAIGAIGGFLAGSSRRLVQQAEPASEIGRYQFLVGQAVVGNYETNQYLIFDTKTARAWQMSVRPDLDGGDVEWYTIPSQFDSVKRIKLEKGNPPAPNPDAPPESN